MRLCGIDPGSNGAMCVLDSSSSAYTALLDLKKHSNYEAAKWLHHQQVDEVWIEDVHSLHGMSAKSNFSFGRNLGFVIAISEIITQDGAIHKVTPKVWQQYVGVTAKGLAIKKDVAQIASSLYPGVELKGPKGGLMDGRSDSLMIAHYGLNHRN